MSITIRDEIVALRRTRVAKEGHGLGVALPRERVAPLCRFDTDPWVICEVKRRSPSRGAIDADLDPVELAGRYRAAGCRSVSVLTEEDHFSGSLRDLLAVKARYPDLAVLRKDFLLDEEDIRVSYRAGADAVLLIASILDPRTLERLAGTAAELGLAVLVEVHHPEDVERVRSLRPALVGINARNLETFAVDPAHPISLRSRLDFPCRVVFESGIFEEEDAYLAGANHFDGILVGEAVVRNPDRVSGLVRGLSQGRQAGANDFWYRLFARRSPHRPLAKICGIARAEDGRAAAAMGADILGFVFADSPRRALPRVPRELADLDVLRVAVVVDELPDDLQPLLDEGVIDAVQFHGAEPAEECFTRFPVYYKALRPNSTAEVQAMDAYRSPRKLIDAHHPVLAGGTGSPVSSPVVAEARRRGPLWLAGGLGPDSIARIVSDYSPELVDASSRLEERPGEKSHHALNRYFEELTSALR